MADGPPELPFGLDRARTFEGGRGGEKRDLGAGPPEWLSPRHRLLLGLVMFAVLVVGVLAGATVAAFAAGARGAASVLALLTLAALPLLAVGPVQDWWRFRRGRRVR